MTIVSATLSEGGFVAVYNGTGSLLGTSEYLEAGAHENATVTVTRPLETPDGVRIGPQLSPSEWMEATIRGRMHHRYQHCFPRASAKYPT